MAEKPRYPLPQLPSRPLGFAAPVNDLPIPGTFIPNPPPRKTIDEIMRGLSYGISQDIGQAGNSVAQALMTPGNALRGDYNNVSVYPSGYVSPVSEALIRDANNMAGVVTTGSMPMPRPMNSLGMGGFVAQSANDIERLARSKGVSLSLSESGGKLTVSKIVVPPEMRNQGIGTEIMSAVTQYADAVGKPVTLTPSTDFGGRSVKTLEAFYKRLGFGSNTGRSKDFSFTDTMVRYPSGR